MIGEAPSCLSKAADPLSGASGNRVRRLMGLTLGQYQSIPRANLFDEPRPVWNADLASALAERMCLRSELHDRRVILWGRRVAISFGLGDTPFLQWTRCELVHQSKLDSDFTVIPHPSGLNRWWNDEGNLRQAHEFLAGIGRDHASSLAKT